jgi:hypothetical protein
MWSTSCGETNAPKPKYCKEKKSSHGLSIIVFYSMGKKFTKYAIEKRQIKWICTRKEEGGGRGNFLIKSL